MNQPISLSSSVNRVEPRRESTVPRSLRRFLALDDFEPVARSRLPRQIYGYFAGAAERNHAHADNFAAFAELALVPRSLADVSGRSLATSLFGQSYAAPFGIAPMGLSALSTFEGDVALAREAAAAGIPSIMSATSLVPLEEVAARAPGRWFQAYLPGEDDRIIAMVDRVAKAGFRNLRTDGRRAGAGQPREQRAHRLQHTAEPFAAPRLRRPYASRAGSLRPGARPSGAAARRISRTWTPRAGRRSCRGT